jgi:hypothetical protein
MGQRMLPNHELLRGIEKNQLTSSSLSEASDSKMLVDSACVVLIASEGLSLLSAIGSMFVFEIAIGSSSNLEFDFSRLFWCI